MDPLSWVWFLASYHIFRLAAIFWVLGVSLTNFFTTDIIPAHVFIKPSWRNVVSPPGA